MSERTDPNTIPDEVADAAQIEHYEFVFGWDREPLTPRQLGISRQSWKCAIAVALDRIPETLKPNTEDTIRRLKDSGVSAYSILSVVTKVYDMEVKE